MTAVRETTGCPCVPSGVAPGTERLMLRAAPKTYRPARVFSKYRALWGAK